MKSTIGILLLALSAARAEPVSGDTLQSAPDSIYAERTSQESFWDWASWDDDELDRHIVVNRPEDSAVVPVHEIAVVQTGDVIVVQPEVVYEPLSGTWGYYSPQRHEERVALASIPSHERIVQEPRHDPEVAMIHHDEEHGHDEEQSPPRKEAPQEQSGGHNLFNAPSERPSRDRGMQR